MYVIFRISPPQSHPGNFPRFFVAVSLWLTMSWIWIPCWFCNYRERYNEDHRDFFDYFLSTLQLQLKIIIGIPLALACALPPRPSPPSPRAHARARHKLRLTRMCQWVYPLLHSALLWLCHSYHSCSCTSVCARVAAYQTNAGATPTPLHSNFPRFLTPLPQRTLLLHNILADRP